MYISGPPWSPFVCCKLPQPEPLRDIESEAIFVSLTLVKAGFHLFSVVWTISIMSLFDKVGPWLVRLSVQDEAAWNARHRS